MQTSIFAMIFSRKAKVRGEIYKRVKETWTTSKSSLLWANVCTMAIIALYVQQSNLFLGQQPPHPTLSSLEWIVTRHPILNFAQLRSQSA